MRKPPFELEDPVATPPPTLEPGSTPAHGLGAVLLAAVKASGSRRILVITHRSPDPDALGAMVGCRMLIEAGYGLEATLATSGRIFRAENLAMVRELSLRFGSTENLDPAEFAGCVLVDSQPGFGHTEVPDGVPLLGVLDHHVPPGEGEALAGVPHADVRQGLGATSSLLWEYLRDLGADVDDETATALLCGVRFDTTDLAQSVTPLDEEAYFECLRRADRERLRRIARPYLPEVYYRELHRSLRMAKRYGSAVVALLGPVANPESVAEMADFFQRMEAVEWAFVGGEYGGQYYVSLRTKLGTTDAYRVMQQLLGDEGSFGGRGCVAGGRVDLDDSDEYDVRKLERRLRRRVLEVVDPNEELDEEARLGSLLT